MMPIDIGPQSDEPLLGPVPEPPDDVWDRMLAATFAAPADETHDDLIPVEAAHDDDLEFDTIAAIADPTEAEPFEDHHESNPFDDLGIDEHHEH